MDFRAMPYDRVLTPWRAVLKSQSRALRAIALSRETKTIYFLSKEGARRALTTPRTVAIAEAMEERAERQGGRLGLPALFAMDELANLTRWAYLPDQFRHYGSKGLIVIPAVLITGSRIMGSHADSGGT